MKCQCLSLLAVVIDKYSMREFSKIGEELFNKLRGRFSSVTIGDSEGNVTNEPIAARYFDFDYNGLGKVSVNLDEDEGLTVIFSKDFVEGTSDVIKQGWHDFLKELRVFGKKRMLDFSVRDITKSNLDKRDYKFLATNRSGDDNMNESKLYGTSRISYQNVGEARIMIKHTESVNQETATGRTQKIGKIYIESPEGERFKYPYKHLSGARAMARHVAEGGKPFDDFGTHITGLSEEMSKLRKFKNYMGRSAVMAESLAGYTDIVKERIATVKKTIESLQKPAYYKETFEAFETPVFEDVPNDVAENWIDELTIKQFNEELQDIFPYIYNLVKEGTKAVELGPDDLAEVAGPKDCWDGYKKDGTQAGTGKNKGKRVNKCVPEDAELEQGFEGMMGQFAEAKECEECNCAPCECDTNEDNVQEGTIETAQDASDALGVLRGKGKKIETGDGEYEGNLANEYANEVWNVYSFIEAKTKGFRDIDPKFQSAIDDMMTLRGEAKKLETKPGSGKNGKFGNQIVNTLYPVMQYIDAHDFNQEEGNAYSGAVAKAKMNGKKKGDKIDGPDGDEITLEKDQKTPLGEFILSYFDRENGEFPKGETAVLTMVEKDYGEKFIDPAKAFIEQIQAKFEEHQMRTQPQQMEAPDTGDFDRMRELAGLR
jgi:hypothetical protein